MTGVTTGSLAAASGPFCLRCLRPTREGGAEGSNFLSFLLSPSFLRSPGKFCLLRPPGVPWPMVAVVVVGDWSRVWMKGAMKRKKGEDFLEFGLRRTQIKEGILHI